MKENKKQEEKENLSYEDLQKENANLQEAIRSMYIRMNQIDMSNTFKRIDYCFKTLEHSDMFCDLGYGEFIKSIAEELVNALTIPKEAEEEENGGQVKS